uniref:SH3GL interacting endocytic adaptor 1 n=1 Tax=Seriola dumerili TaxID=41447 RepID=A0A3B4UHU0_SERDU
MHHDTSCFKGDEEKEATIGNIMEDNFIQPHFDIESTGLKKRTRKAFGIRKKEKDNDSTGSPDRDGGHSSAEYTVPPVSGRFLIILSLSYQSQKKTNGAPNGFYGDIDWDRYNSPEVDDEGGGDFAFLDYGILPTTKKPHFFSSDESEEEEDHRKKFKIKIKPLPADQVTSVPSVDELKASIGNIALSPSPLVSSSDITVLSLLGLTHRALCISLFYPQLSVSNFLCLSTCLSVCDFLSLSVNLLENSDWSLVICVSEASTEADGRKPSIADLDNIFGPEQSPPPGEDTADTWVCFSEESSNRPPLPKDPELASPPASSPPPVDTPASVPPASVPKASTPPAVTPPSEESATRSVPPPLVLSQEEQPKNTDATQPKEDVGETVSSPKDASQGSRTTPPPPPPPTYRAVVSSPGPTSGAGGTNSGSSSPVRPATPSSVNPTPPPPPPRPPSRPKLPPGKPTVGDVNRPFSPPVHSASPPPIAPLARAESTSSISSTNSLSAATTPTVENDQPSLVWFDRGKFYLTFEGCSRGPSPLTMGAQDTLPVAAAFTETVNAFFKGADPSKCVVKIIGEMVLSFPAGITRHFANNPSPAVLTFSITNYSRLEHVLPNPQLLLHDQGQMKCLCFDFADAKDFWVNMPNLISHLKKVAEQKPQATYYNVDMLKYQVSVQGLQSTPLNLAVSWRCEPTSTDLRIDYKYNGEAMSTAMALNNVQFLVPVDGGVSKLQAVLPPAAWNAEQQRILWKIPDISQKSENGGVGSLLARFQLTEGPSKPAPLAVQFTSEGSTLSGCDIELAGPGYRFSLIKKRFAAGQFSILIKRRCFPTQNVIYHCRCC